jgi:hypothetical protein
VDRWLADTDPAHLAEGDPSYLAFGELSDANLPHPVPRSGTELRFIGVGKRLAIGHAWQDRAGRCHGTRRIRRSSVPIQDHVCAKSAPRL